MNTHSKKRIQQKALTVEARILQMVADGQTRLLIEMMDEWKLDLMLLALGRGDVVIREDWPMNANLAFHALQDVAKTVERPSINITPSVLDFAGQNANTLRSLGRVSNALERAVYAGSMSVAMMSADDFDVLKRYVAYADGEFAIAGVARRDTAVDQPFSPDESHHRDRERL